MKQPNNDEMERAWQRHTKTDAYQHPHNDNARFHFDAGYLAHQSAQPEGWVKLETIKRPHISEVDSVSEIMEHKQIAELIFSASTALSNQWSPSYIQQLENIAQAFRQSVSCCNDRKLEYAHGQDGEYVRCRACSYSYGSASARLISERLLREENDRLRKGVIKEQKSLRENLSDAWKAAEVTELKAEIERHKAVIEEAEKDFRTVRDECYVLDGGSLAYHTASSALSRIRQLTEEK